MESICETNINISKVSIILPTYNESENIIDLIELILKLYTKYNFEILVMDDDSPDLTGVTVREYYKNDDRIKVFIRKKNRGLGNSIKDGVKKSSGDYILLMDSDFNHNPVYIAEMLNKIKDNDIVVGSRYEKGGGMKTSKIRYYLSYLFNLFVKFSLLLPFSDNLSGYLIIKRKKLQEFDIEKIFYGYGDFCIRLLYLAHKNKLKVKSIPVVYDFRHGGYSKTSFISTFIKYCKAVIEIKNKFK